jgi:hypothetical protein
VVKNTAFLLLAALGVSSPSIAGGQPQKHQLTIEKIVIDKNGAWLDKRSSSDETPENCASFILKESDIRRFFEISRPSSSHEQVHDLEVSRCHAEGSAVLKDGREGTWLIDRARQGVFEFKDGNALYFYCTKCTNKLYWSQ